MALKKRGLLVFGIPVNALIWLMVLIVGITVSYQVINNIRSIQEEAVEKVIEEEAEFLPYEKEYTSIATDSMKALITAINAVATGKDVNKYSGNKISPKILGFDSYEIYFSGSIEIAEAGADDDRYWMFSRTFPVNTKVEEVNKLREDVVFADYFYGSCNDDNEGHWVDCDSGYPKRIDDKYGECYCEDEDDFDDGYRDQNIDPELISKAKEIKLAATTDLTPVYNIKLETYKDGKVECSASTISKTSKTGKMTDKDEWRLYLWGYHKNPLWKPKGSDRNENGIQGSYGEEFYDKNWTDVVPSKYRSNIIEKGLDKVYFPDGKIQRKEGNGEYCLDSPNWLECPGVRIYYCARRTSKTNVFDAPDKQFYLETSFDDGIHARAGIMTYRVYDERFTGYVSNTQSGEPGFSSADCYSYSGTDTPYDECKGFKDVRVRGTGWEAFKTWIKSVIDFIVSIDLDVLFGTILAGPILGGGGALDMKEMDDPDVFCQDGKEFGMSTVKCTNTIDGGCGVCDFNLPQDVPDVGVFDWSVEWFAGFGDPQYVVYYEAFPPGEAEAWHVDPMTVGLTTIAALNVGIPVGGTIIKGAAKIGKGVVKLFVKTSAPGIAYALGKLGYKAVMATTRGPNFIKRVGKTIKELTDMTLAKKALDQGVKQFKFISRIPKTVKDQVASGAKAFASNPATSLFKLPFKYPKTLLRTGSKYAAGYLVGLVAVREDSMNDKYLPLGVNEIGMKKPYDYVFMTGEQLPELDDNVTKYYIQLIKDKYKGGLITGLLLDQPGERFWLASPCWANLAVVKTKCQCWEIDEPTVVHDFGGGNIHVLKPFFNPGAEDPYWNAIKVCRDKGAGLGSIATLWEDPVYTPDCINVNPVLKGDTFCYSGSHTLAEIAKIGVLVTTLVVDFALEVAFDAASLVALPTGVGFLAFQGAKIGLITFVDSLGAFIENELAKTTKWPNH